MKKKIFWIVLAVLGVLIIGSILDGHGDQKNAATDAPETVTAETASDQDEQKASVVESKWKYYLEKDEMTDAETKIASIVSDNEVEFDFPYDGGSSMTLFVRKSAKYGTDVFIKVSKGQFICNEFNGTNKINIRFDDNAPMQFYVSEPSDASSDVLFLKKASKFIGLAKDAKVIKIEAPFFQEGNRVFTFTTPIPLEWE